MRKSNLITFFSFMFIIAASILYMVFLKSHAASPALAVDGTDGSTQSNTHPSTSTTSSTLPSTSEPTSQPIKPEAEQTSSTTSATTKKPSETTTLPTTIKPVSMNDSLFIGDSRTVGLSEYAGIQGADFFANVGMSVYNINEKTVSVPTVGKVKFTELLKYRKYKKIYIMLGINELGYNFNKTVNKYREIIKQIQAQQPDAIIFIQANLHVTRTRSNSDKVINNKSINNLNAAIAQIADNTKIFYLDANVLFDDENGDLSSDKSEDNAHLYAKYYAEWGKWIITQTALIMGGG